MSRSIHTTHGEYAREKRWLYASTALHKERLLALARALQKKRRVKHWSRASRRSPSALDVPPLAADSLSIEVVDDGPRIHYPASPDDIRAVLRRLPAGVLTGLSRIRLGLGLASMEEGLTEEERREEERDPWHGRIGSECLPGVYCGNTLGSFDASSSRIDIHAYVYDAEIDDSRRWECFLRLEMLATLLHELAHFEDRQLRRARGRWRADDEDQNESHAERTAANWVRDIAVPWLRAAYPDAVQDLEAWVLEHGGAEIALELLAGSWRWDSEGRVVDDALFGGARSAFQSLVRDLHQGAEPSAARLQFAEELHYGELYPEARRVLERILREEPTNLAARTLEADIYWHEGNHDRAEVLAAGVIARDASFVDAWRVLANVHQSRADWERLCEAAGQAIARCDDERDRWSFREQRARAELELGKEAELASDLEALTRSVPMAASAAATIRALQLLRRRWFHEALEVVQSAPPSPRHRAVLDAVRFEAAHRLGRPGLAGRLTSEKLLGLRHQHLGAWADRLVSEFGPEKTY